MSYIVVFFCVYFAVVCVECSEIETNGDAYIYHRMESKHQIIGPSETLSLTFKTIHASGLLFYAESSSGHYLSLELVHCKLRYTVNLVNSASRDIEPFVFTYADQLCDNTRHNVYITRDRKELKIYLDSKAAKIVDIRQAKLQNQYVLVVQEFNVAGTWNAKNINGGGLMKNFVGCISDVLFNGYKPISDAHRNKTGYEVFGKISYTCRDTKYTPITFTSDKGVLKIPSAKHRVSVSFSFRTYDKNGILVYRDGPKVSVYVYLKEGKLKLDYINDEVAIPLVLDTSKFVKDDLNDGLWHTVKMGVDNQYLSLSVDGDIGVNTSVHRTEQKMIVFEDTTYIGGGTYYRQMHGFVGCLRNLIVNDIEIDLVSLKSPVGIKSRFVVKNKCTTSSLCHPTACQYGSECEQKVDNYTCHCKRFYTGRHCQTPLYQANCQKYKEYGMKEDAYCVVDPDMSGPLPDFTVLCNMTSGLDAITILNHTFAGQSVLVQDATRYSTARENWYHNIKYGISPSNLRKLVDSSHHCRQYVQFDCIDTKFFESDDVDVYGASWITVDAQNRYYWGGTSGSSGCSCGNDKSCYDTSKRCNCETGDGTWRQDSGYITTKSDLPVMGIFFPDTAKDSKFIVGPLECFGGEKQLKRDKNEQTFVDIACEPLMTTSPPLYPWQRDTTPTPLPYTSVTTKYHTSESPSLGNTTTSTTGSIPPSSQNSTIASTVQYNTSQTPTRNSSGTNHVPVRVLSVKKSKEKQASWLFIVIIAASIVVFILLITFLLVLVRHKRANGVWCTGLFKFSTCGGHQQLPKIEIYRHSLATDSPDILHMNDFKNSKVIDLHIHRGHFMKKSSPKKKKTVTFRDETC